MRRLWAPWRITYILSPKPDRCIFCECTREERDEENYVLYRGERTFAIMNIYPYNTGHVMVAPYTHTPSIEDLTYEETAEMMEVAKLLMRAMRRSLNPDGFNLGLNIGRIAGAGIEDHVHLHIVPRWSGDTNFMPVIGDVKVIPESIRETYSKIRRALEEIGEGDV